MTAPKQPETREFAAEVRELLDLMVHSLYSHREIFLRELISNASDALDRLRLESLKQPDLMQGGSELFVLLELDPSLRLLRVVDNGIGMSREELIENLGTIARSGTKRFAQQLEGAGEGASPAALIGQFGVGFYSSFMVADEVTVETRRAGAVAGLCWRSAGDGRYTIEELEVDERGTSVTLHVRTSAEGDEEQDFDAFLRPEVLAELVAKYSDFVEYPIVMDRKHFAGREDLKTMEIEGRTVCVLNSRKPLWARPKEEIRPEEYAAFYQHLSHDWREPLETIHFKAEGASEYTALLYLPGHRPLDWLDPRTDKSRIALYVRRVLIMSECEDLLPPWLRFVRGIVDARDLPLNVSREILQANRAIGQVRSRLIRKVLDSLERMLEKDRARYRGFWSAFGPVLKEGMLLDSEHSEAIGRVALFETSQGEEPTTLTEYIARANKTQSEIYVLFAPDRAAAQASPHAEALLARGAEVLYLLDPIDEWILQRRPEQQGKRLVSIGHGVLPGADSEELERAEREHRTLLEALEAHLKGEVSKVRFSSRLTESPAVLVDEEGAPGRSMRALLRQAQGEVPAPKRVLELNPAHPIIGSMSRWQAEEPARLSDCAELLHGLALLAEGSAPRDTRRFAKRIAELMIGPS